MKTASVVLWLLLPVLAWGTTTTVADTIYGVDEVGANGTIYITISNACTGAGGEFVGEAQKEVSVVSGAFTVNLVPNDTCTPANTSYSIRYDLDEGQWNERWSVPTSGSPVDRATVLASSVTPAAATIGYASISGCTAKGSVLAASGTSMGCETVGTNDFVLTADSGQTNGVKWAALGATLDVLTGASAMSTDNFLICTDGTTGLTQLCGGISQLGTANVTQLLLQAGSAQSTNDLVRYLNNAGTRMSVINAEGVFQSFVSGTTNMLVGGRLVRVGNLSSMNFYDAEDPQSANVQLSLAHGGAGIFELDDSSGNDFALDVSAMTADRAVVAPDKAGTLAYLDDIQSNASKYCVPLGGTDTYTCTLTPTLTAYVAGMVLVFNPDVDNTGAATINVDSLGAKAIKVLTSGAQADPANSDIDANWIYDCAYNGTSFLCTRDGAGGGGTGLAPYRETVTGISLVMTLEEHGIADVNKATWACYLAPGGGDNTAVEVPDSVVAHTPTADDVTVTFSTSGDYACTLDGGGGVGDVVGPASATDGAVALFDGTSGNLLKDSTAAGVKTLLSLNLVENTALSTWAGTVNITTVAEAAVTSHEAAIDHDALNNFDANEHFLQSAITTLGTIGTGVWQGSVIAEAYLPNASLTAQGVVELATGAETNTGTDATRAVTPDGLDDWTGSAQVATVAEGAVTAHEAALSITESQISDLAHTDTTKLPLAGGTMTGQLTTDNLGIEFEDSDTNPTCGAGNYNIFADLSETTLKKCVNGVATVLDTTGGTPAFSDITGATNTAAAMVVGTGASLGVSGSGTIAATSYTVTSADVGTASASLDDTDATVEWEDAADLDATGAVTAASTTTAGKSELATAAETSTGTDTGRAVTPDGLAGSDYGKKTFGTLCVADATALSTGDGKCYIGPMISVYNGWNVIEAVAGVGAAISSSGAITVDIDRCGVVATGIRCSGANVSIFSTLLTVDANEDSSSTAATAADINESNDDLTTDQWLRVNIDGAGTGTQGLYVWVTIQKP